MDRKRRRQESKVNSIIAEDINMFLSHMSPHIINIFE